MSTDGFKDRLTFTPGKVSVEFHKYNDNQNRWPDSIKGADHFKFHESSTIALKTDTMQALLQLALKVTTLEGSLKQANEVIEILDGKIDGLLEKVEDLTEALDNATAPSV